MASQDHLTVKKAAAATITWKGSLAYERGMPAQPVADLNRALLTSSLSDPFTRNRSECYSVRLPPGGLLGASEPGVLLEPGCAPEQLPFRTGVSVQSCVDGYAPHRVTFLGNDSYNTKLVTLDSENPPHSVAELSKRVFELLSFPQSREVESPLFDVEGLSPFEEAEALYCSGDLDDVVNHFEAVQFEGATVPLPVISLAQALYVVLHGHPKKAELVTAGLLGITNATLLNSLSSQVDGVAYDRTPLHPVGLRNYAASCLIHGVGEMGTTRMAQRLMAYAVLWHCGTTKALCYFAQAPPCVVPTSVIQPVYAAAISTITQAQATATLSRAGDLGLTDFDQYVATWSVLSGGLQLGVYSPAGCAGPIHGALIPPTDPDIVVFELQDLGFRSTSDMTLEAPDRGRAYESVSGG